MPILFFISIFTITFALSVFFTYLIRKTAVKLNIIDYPNVERKIHKNPVPLLGGAGIFLAFFIMLFFVKSYILSGSLEPRHWLGVFVGALILLIGGILDDKYNLKPSRQLIFPILAALAVVAGGVGIEKIGNPFLSLAPARKFYLSGSMENSGDKFWRPVASFFSNQRWPDYYLAYGYDVHY